MKGKEIATADQPLKPDKVTRVTIEASSWDEQRLCEMILGRVAEDVRERVDAAIHRQVREAVNATIQKFVEERVAVEVEAIFAEGWRKTDGYGTPQGPPITLRDRVSEILQHRDRYSNNGLSNLDALVAKSVDETLRGDLGKEIEEAKKRVREMLDTKVMEKLSAALKEGLGLRP